MHLHAVPSPNSTHSALTHTKNAQEETHNKTPLETKTSSQKCNF